MRGGEKWGKARPSSARRQICQNIGKGEKRVVTSFPADAFSSSSLGKKAPLSAEGASEWTHYVCEWTPPTLNCIDAGPFPRGGETSVSDRFSTANEVEPKVCAADGQSAPLRLGPVARHQEEEKGSPALSGWRPCSRCYLDPPSFHPKRRGENGTGAAYLSD